MGYRYDKDNPTQGYESRNQEQIDALNKEYTERGQFSYDPEADAAYQNYVKAMKDNGQKAMQDTMGKAASMTGGYGNSYAASVGQQVYNDYMSQASAAQADFEDRALARYNAEGDQLLSKLSLLQNQESTDRANWESDYAKAWSEAQLQAEYGNMGPLAQLLGKNETDMKLSLGYGEVPEELVDGLKNAIKNGKGTDYLNSLAMDGYDPKSLVETINRWNADGSLGGVASITADNIIEFTPDKDPEEQVYGMGSIILNSINGIDGSPETGEKFNVVRTNKSDATSDSFHHENYGEAGDNWNLELGKEYTDGEEFDKLTKQSDGFCFYGGEPYYISGGRVFKVSGKDYEYLKKYLSDQYT